jgi:hypothetical protein
VIWVDEARARMQLQLLGVVAARLGWEGFDQLEDPADLLTAEPDPMPAGRATDPVLRAAQVAAFLAAAG